MESLAVNRKWLCDTQYKVYRWTCGMTEQTCLTLESWLYPTNQCSASSGFIKMNTCLNVFPACLTGEPMINWASSMCWTVSYSENFESWWVCKRLLPLKPECCFQCNSSTQTHSSTHHIYCTLFPHSADCEEWISTLVSTAMTRL